MSKTVTLIKYYNRLSGNSISLNKLKEYREAVQKHIDSEGHGPYMKELSGILDRVSKAIKQMIAAGATVVERVQITPVDISKPVTQYKKRPKARSEKKKTFLHKSRGKKKKLKTLAKPEKVNPVKQVPVKKVSAKKIIKPKPAPPAPKTHTPKVVKPIKHIHGMVDAQTLAGVDFRVIELPKPYKADFERLHSDTSVMVWGVPGSGKTVYLLKFGQALAQIGMRVLYVANEEFGRSTLSEKIRQFKIGHPNFKFTKRVTDEIISDFDVVFFDSINSIGYKLKDYQKLRDRHPGKLFILIVQTTKDGDFRGGKDWEHEVDVAGEIVNRKLILRKNRLDPDNNKKAEAWTMEQMVNKAKQKAQVKSALKQHTTSQAQNLYDQYKNAKMAL